MARKKSGKILNVFKIFFSSIYSFFLYLDQTSKTLSFPIFGQIISLSLIFTLTYLFINNVDKISSSCSFFQNDTNLLITFIVILIPLFLVFIKAFYRYLVNFTSLNLLFYTHANKKTAKKIDFTANNNVIKRKMFKYIVLLLLVSLLFLVPPLFLIAPITGIFLCFTFQVFALEGDISPIKAISRSIELVKSNFIPTILMLLLCIGLTYIYLPVLFIWACEKSSAYCFFVTNCEKLYSLIPFNEFNNFLQSNPFVSLPDNLIEPLSLAKITVEGVISFIIINYTLPLRCCCFSELYKLFDSDKIKDFSKSSDEIIARACGKKGKN